MFKNFGTFGSGFIIGLGAGFVLREVMPHFKDAAKPIAKGVTKAGMELYDGAMESYEGIREGIEDLIAESRFEIKTRKMQRAQHKAPAKKKTRAKPAAKARVKKKVGGEHVIIH